MLMHLQQNAMRYDDLLPNKSSEIQSHTRSRTAGLPHCVLIDTYSECLSCPSVPPLFSSLLPRLSFLRVTPCFWIRWWFGRLYLSCPWLTRFHLVFCRSLFWLDLAASLPCRCSLCVVSACASCGGVFFVWLLLSWVVPLLVGPLPSRGLFWPFLSLREIVSLACSQKPGNAPRLEGVHCAHQVDKGLIKKFLGLEHT